MYQNNCHWHFGLRFVTSGHRFQLPFVVVFVFIAGSQAFLGLFFAGQQSVAMSACSGNWPLTESRPSPLAANQLRVRRIRRRELLRSGIWREKGCFKLKQSCSGK